MEDLITRRAAISTYKTLCQGTACKGCPFFDSKGMTDCRLLRALRKVQSAQPKTGKWILIRPDEDKAGNGLYECSECGKGDIHAPEAEVPFCWHCGARMEADDETN